MKPPSRKQPRYPRYPQSRRTGGLRFLLPAVVFLVALVVAYNSFGPDGRTSSQASSVTGASQSTQTAQVSQASSVAADSGGAVDITPAAGDVSATDGMNTEEYPSGPLAKNLQFDRLLLEKSAHRLTAFFKGKPVRIYTVALGRAPVGHKQFEGDMKTPEGKYTIDAKNPNSAYHKNMNISYPNKADREYAARHNQPPGGDIKIHGLAPSFAVLGAAHRLSDWTFGCVAVTNPEIDELYARTLIGTPIEITP